MASSAESVGQSVGRSVDLRARQAVSQSSVDPRARQSDSQSVRRSVCEHAGLSVSRAVGRLVHAPTAGQSVSRTVGQTVRQC